MARGQNKTNDPNTPATVRGAGAQNINAVEAPTYAQARATYEAANYAPRPAFCKSCGKVGMRGEILFKRRQATEARPKMFYADLCEGCWVKDDEGDVTTLKHTCNKDFRYGNKHKGCPMCDAYAQSIASTGCTNNPYSDYCGDNWPSGCGLCGRSSYTD